MMNNPSTLLLKIKGALNASFFNKTFYHYNPQKFSVVHLYRHNCRHFNSLQRTTGLIFKSFQQSCLYIHRNLSTVTPLLKTEKMLNNVLIYKCDRTRFFRIFFVFVVVQIVSITFAAANIFTVYYNDFVKQYSSWKEKLENIYFPASILTVLCIAAPVLPFVFWIWTRKSIKYIVLLKGGNRVQFTTYHPLKGETTFTVPLDHVNCTRPRSDQRGFISLQVKNHSLKYVVERQGQFPNPQLFDQTVGLSRKMK